MSNAKYASGEYALAICDRCRMTCKYSELRKDGNSPGVMVCSDPGCWDRKDPYRLPPRQPDAIALRHPRPMVHVIPYRYRNVPVYEGGPLQIGSPDEATDFDFEEDILYYEPPTRRWEN